MFMREEILFQIAHISRSGISRNTCVSFRLKQLYFVRDQLLSFSINKILKQAKGFPNWVPR